MNAEQTSSLGAPAIRRNGRGPRSGRLLIVAALCGLTAQSSLATPFPASVTASLNGSAWDVNGTLVPTVVDQALGPVLASETRATAQFAGARTDYGSNGSASSLWATRPWSSPGTGSTGWVQATSKWTDQLTLYTPDAALDAPVDLVFSIGLQGHIEGTRTDFVSLGGHVRYSMLLNEYGSWVSRPSLWRDLWEDSGGSYDYHDRIDVDEVQLGRFTVPNGRTFNLISELGTRVTGGFWGPWGTAFSVESSFGNTVSWMGGQVWVGSRPASSYTITSASGFNYGQQTAVVPEPSMLAQLALGLAGLTLARRRARGRALAGSAAQGQGF